MLEVMRGKKPDRPSGFSDTLWNLLLAAWDADYGYQPSKRPPIQAILNQLREDGEDWDEFFSAPRPLEVEGKESCAYPKLGSAARLLSCFL